MMHKLRRLCSYFYELAMMAICKFTGLFLRAFCPSYRGLWLVCERGDDARDNGWWLYKYLKEQHPEINARYIIDPHSADAAKIEALGGAVAYRSFRHYLMYYSADRLAGTHVQPCAPDLMIHYHLAHKGIKARGKQIFLQHGIINNEMMWLRRGAMDIDLFVCGGKPEYDYVHSEFGYREGVVQYLGLCRFDNLKHSDAPKKMILVMPTWRGSRYPSGKDFVNTNYFKAFDALLHSKRIAELLEQYGYTMVFYPHIEMQKDMHYFTTDCPNIILANKQTHDVQQLLMECAMLVTDYSSVFFDVAYLLKPEIYYQFDREEYYQYHYQKGYFDHARDGFGPVCETASELEQAIEQYLTNGMRPSGEHLTRIQQFFPLCDDKNCERTFDAIQNL